MAIASVAHYVVGGLCLAMGLLHLSLFCLRPQRRADLFFAVMCLCATGDALCWPWVYGAQDVAEFVLAAKVRVTFHALFWIALVWFTSFYTRLARPSLAWVLTGVYAMAMIVNLVAQYGLLYASISSLQTTSLPLGGIVSSPVGELNPWLYITDLAWLALIYYVAESCWRLYGRGDKGRALVLAVSIFFSLVLGYLHGILIDFELLPPPELFTFVFLPFLVTMSFSLTKEVARATELTKEVVTGEERWRMMLDQAQLMAVEVDTEGIIIDVNPNFLEVTGYETDEVVGRRFWGLLSEPEREEFKQRFSRMGVSGLRSRGEAPYLAKQGKILQVAWSVLKLVDAEGEIIGALGLGEDVTELRLAEREVEEERKRMDTVLASQKTGLSLINPDMTVAWVNELVRKLLPWDDPIGKLCYKFAEDRDAPCEGCATVKAFADGQVHERENYNDKSGQWHRLVSVPIKDETGRVLQVLESLTDITTHKEAEQDRDRTMAELSALKKQLEQENVLLLEEISQSPAFGKIIHASRGMQYVLSKIEQVAKTDASVLIQGETGVGKEIVARTIHTSSARAAGPMVKVDCASLSESLLASELFGYEVGAFTGASRRRRGRFELAHGGTIFLDEISEIPLDMQANLLRVLEDRQIERLGGSKTIDVDVRILAATNRDLQKEVAAGRFRADLFYRLNVYPITVPPLRNRQDDIPVLVWHFLMEMAKRAGKEIDKVPKVLMDNMMAYEWPGNVRELRNILERAVITSTGRTLRLAEPLQGNSVTGSTEAEETSLVPLAEAERIHILLALKKTGWRISGENGAAEILELNPSTLRFRMKKLGIKRS